MTILNQINYGGSCCAKNCDSSKKGTQSIAEKSQLVRTFQYNERPVMNTERNEGRKGMACSA